MLIWVAGNDRSVFAGEIQGEIPADGRREVVEEDRMGSSQLQFPLPDFKWISGGSPVCIILIFTNTVLNPKLVLQYWAHQEFLCSSIIATNFKAVFDKMMFNYYIKLMSLVVVTKPEPEPPLWRPGTPDLVRDKLFLESEFKIRNLYIKLGRFNM